MANEFLTRVPTSTGNQKVFTYSCWIKRNKVSDWMRLLSIMNGNTDAIIQLTNVDKLRFRDEVTGPDIDYISSRPLRDVGSWMHLLVAIDTTAIQAEHRIRMYVNGDSLIEHGLDTESMPGDRNLDLQFNDKLEHRFFARNSNSEYFFGEAFDLFWVDGQALTPDVFGFNKDGDGYISVGSTQATDFRPGQWSPKAPRIIKSEINRRGGFGVNGFYLPMNDSSNFGADFHCTPNSIITLKGEDLPQPRNGLPTTSDNYVSQLRSDPYAANLVLAVPGVNTQPTGSELITNGTFDTDVSGWTITDTGTIVRQSDGTAKVTRGSSAEVVYQDITTVVGTTYELSVDITDIAGSHGQVYVKSTPHSGSLDTNIGYSFYAGTYKGTFTADTTTTRITLYAHPSGSSSYDNISVKATTIPDYSADIKGSGTNKTLTPYADASVRNPHQRNGRNVNGYYGSALSLDGTGDVLKTASHADFNLGDGDYTIEGWYYDQETAINTGNRCYWAIGGVNSEGTLTLFRENQYLMLRGRDVGQAYENIIYVTNHDIPVKQWNHICVERVSGRTTLYINGVPLQTTTDTTTIAQGYFTIGAFSSGGSYPYYGYIQDVRVYKGVAKYKGGFDVSRPYSPENGSTNYGIETWRQVPDTCKNNFATFNPISGYETSGLLTFSDGSLTATTTNSNVSVTCNVGMSTGKWYWEYSPTQIQNFHDIGISSMTNPPLGFDDGAISASWRTSTGQIRQGNTDVQATGMSASVGDIVQIAFNADTRRMWVGVNGSYYNSGDPAAGTNSTYQTNLTADTYFFAASYHGSGTHSGVANFGQNSSFSGQTTAGTYTDGNGKGLFKYQPPAGYLALCEDNLPTPAIADPGEHFKTVLYTGDNVSNGVGRRSVRGVGFKPDLVWIKCRNQAQNHVLYDSVRGLQCLNSNSTAAESTFDSQILGGYDEDGFTTSPNNDSNYNGQSFVAWCWKAGGAAVSNTDGSINSQVSVNQTAGFSIVSWTGNGSSSATVGHGLNKTPAFSIVKSRDTTADWWVYFGSDDFARSRLNLTHPGFRYDNNNALKHAPDTSVFTLTNFLDNNVKYIAYSWAEVEGYSKFGSYVANGNADGPFVYCGFKPAWVMIKPYTFASNWIIMDSSRGSVNPDLGWLYPDGAFTEDTGSSRYCDFLSNGFKIRNGGTGVNSTNNPYVFMAFAESPFQTANAK